MKKDDILKAFYQQQINALTDQCADIELLDLIYRLLTEDARTAHNERKIKRCTK